MWCNGGHVPYFVTPLWCLLDVSSLRHIFRYHFQACALASVSLLNHALSFLVCFSLFCFFATHGIILFGINLFKPVWALVLSGKHICLLFICLSSSHLKRPLNFSISGSWPNLVFTKRPCYFGWFINLIFRLFHARFPSDGMTDGTLPVQKVSREVFNKFNLLTFLFNFN